MGWVEDNRVDLDWLGGGSVVGGSSKCAGSWKLIDEPYFFGSNKNKTTINKCFEVDTLIFCIFEFYLDLTT